MKQLLLISLRYTIVTTLLLGIGYPLLITVVAQHVWKDKANGELISQNGTVVGSKLIGQSFTGANYFHSRPSAAGAGYDPMASGGSNWAATSQKLVDRTEASVKLEQAGNATTTVPVDLVTASASGLDPDITPAAAEFQAQRVAHERGLSLNRIQALIQQNTMERQFGLLGERRVNVLQLNLALDRLEK